MLRKQLPFGNRKESWESVFSCLLSSVQDSLKSDRVSHHSLSESLLISATSESTVELSETRVTSLTETETETETVTET